ncbi:HNH endonuclease signature motif containing protein [Variovorax sp. N23]|uniref:HNH endonuclease signature motif containing protein n=1 Tax=Variovorax sp. N23 TaxID=2980555 RepID=UPI0021C8D732|nr:HNH endonuclease signature motif containing protein [Variovorax sp. N23]MCU4119319.1 HNH endonuclease [Variovorax sp. N23]
MAKSDLTAARLRELLHYDPETGVFTRASGGPGIRIGDVAGSLHADGYVAIMLKGSLYQAHRLAMLYVNGQWPDGEVDHRNGNRSDNRIDNLRNTTATVNQQNRQRATVKNKVGLLGVTVRREKFRASITVAGKTRYLGDFDTPELAHQAYLEEKRRVHPGCTI